MSRRTAFAATATTLAAALVLAACGRDSDDADLARLDNQLVGNEADPALTSALQDQILVDPSLSQQSNRNAARSTAAPVQAQYPNGGVRGEAGGCGGDFEYDPSWAGRLAPPFAVYPGARIVEAAANNSSGCRLRAVSFATTDPAPRVEAWYRAAAIRAGYDAELQQRGADRLLAGTSPDGGAYLLVVTPKANGSEVGLITNNGR